MTKKNYFIILLLVSILGFSFSFYTKYIKNYILSIEKIEKLDDNETSVKQLNLSENIAFLEKIKKTKESIGVSNVKGEENTKAIKKLKTINILCITGMTLFLILSIWLIIRMRKFKKQALLTIE